MPKGRGTLGRLPKGRGTLRKGGREGGNEWMPNGKIETKRVNIDDGDKDMKSEDGEKEREKTHTGN